MKTVQVNEGHDTPFPLYDPQEDHKHPIHVGLRGIVWTRLFGPIT